MRVVQAVIAAVLAMFAASTPPWLSQMPRFTAQQQVPSGRAHGGRAARRRRNIAKRG